MPLNFSTNSGTLFYGSPYYFVISIIISLLLATNFVISSGVSCLCVITAKSYNCSHTSLVKSPSLFASTYCTSLLFKFNTSVSCPPNIDESIPYILYIFIISCIRRLSSVTVIIEETLSFF